MNDAPWLFIYCFASDNVKVGTQKNHPLKAQKEAFCHFVVIIVQKLKKIDEQNMCGNHLLEDSKLLQNFTHKTGFIYLFFILSYRISLSWKGSK